MMFKKFINSTKYLYGMTLPEVLVSTALLLVFLSVISNFIAIINKYNPKIEQLTNSSQGLVIDHFYLYQVLDSYIDFLEEPGVSATKIVDIIDSKPIGLKKGCSYNPHLDWDIPIVENSKLKVGWSPEFAGYAICLRSTSITESPFADLVSKSNRINNDASPGIYILLALPSELSSNKIPIRRIFCRPRPYCTK